MAPRTMQAIDPQLGRPPARGPVPPVARAALAQAASVVTVAATLAALPGPHSAIWSAVAVGTLAALLGVALRLPPWWMPLNAAFPLTIVATLSLHIDANWFLLPLGILVAVYWSTFSSRVPLYLSGRKTLDVLETILPRNATARFLDIGCGTGSVLAHLAERQPDRRYVGVEIAPVPFLVSWIRGRFRSRRFTVRRESLWNVDLGEFDVVYAFLSPVPMTELWEKVRTEMRPGSVFISNTFAVPGQPADRVIPVGGRGRCLHVWRL